MSESKTPQSNFFSDIKYAVSGNVDDEVSKLLDEGGAKKYKYIIESITHCILGENYSENDVSLVKDLYDKPCVKQKWVTASAACSVHLPLNPFQADGNQIFSGLKFCTSKITKEDNEILWALITYHGGSFQLCLEKTCSHLLVTNPSGRKYDFAVQYTEKFKIVTPDWIVDCVKEGRKLDEVLYHPKLLIQPKPIQIAVEDVDVTQSSLADGEKVSTAHIIGFTDGDTALDEIADKAGAPSVDQHALDQLRQNLPWNRPSATNNIVAQPKKDLTHTIGLNKVGNISYASSNSTQSYDHKISTLMNDVPRATSFPRGSLPTPQQNVPTSPNQYSPRWVLQQGQEGSNVNRQVSSWQQQRDNVDRWNQQHLHGSTPQPQVQGNPQHLPIASQQQHLQGAPQQQIIQGAPQQSVPMSTVPHVHPQAQMPLQQSVHSQPQVLQHQSIQQHPALQQQALQEQVLKQKQALHQQQIQANLRNQSLQGMISPNGNRMTPVSSPLVNQTPNHANLLAQKDMLALHQSGIVKQADKSAQQMLMNMSSSHVINQQNRITHPGNVPINDVSHMVTQNLGAIVNQSESQAGIHPSQIRPQQAMRPQQTATLQQPSQLTQQQLIQRHLLQQRQLQQMDPRQRAILIQQMQRQKEEQQQRYQQQLLQRQNRGIHPTNIQQWHLKDNQALNAAPSSCVTKDAVHQAQTSHPNHNLQQSQWIQSPTSESLGHQRTGVGLPQNQIQQLRHQLVNQETGSQSLKIDSQGNRLIPVNMANPPSVPQYPSPQSNQPNQLQQQLYQQQQLRLQQRIQQQQMLQKLQVNTQQAATLPNDPATPHYSLKDPQGNIVQSHLSPGSSNQSLHSPSQTQQVHQTSAHTSASLVNQKTKTALANLLSTRLQGQSPNQVQGINSPHIRSGENSDNGGGGNKLYYHNNHSEFNAGNPITAVTDDKIQYARRHGVQGVVSANTRPQMSPTGLHPPPSTPTTPTKSPVYRIGAPALSNISAPVSRPTKAQFYGHDPNIKLPPDLFLLGCVCFICDYDKLETSSEVPTWKRIILQNGGEVEESYSNRITHVLCDHQRSQVVQSALKEGKRCVTAFWLSDVVEKKILSPPSHPLHLPTSFSTDEKPCREHIISITGFDEEERRRLKLMISRVGAKYTGYFTVSNTLLIAKKTEGMKYQKAKEWRKPIVNVIWLSEILLGYCSAIKAPFGPKYQQFNLDDPFKVELILVNHLLAGWKLPVRVNQEIWNKAINSPQRKRKSDPSELDKPNPKLLKTDDDENDINISNPVLLPPEIRPKVLFSGEKKDQFYKKVLKLGGELAKSPSEATHLVMSSLKRTVKLLCGIACCKFLVNPAWLIDSYSQGKFLSEKMYLLKDSQFEDTYSIDILQVMSLPNRKSLFKGKEFYITPGVYPNRSSLFTIIECSGGTIVKKRTSIKSIKEKNRISLVPSYMIISCEDDLHLVKDCLQSGIAVYNAEWVLLSVMRQEMNYNSLLLRQGSVS